MTPSLALARRPGRGRFAATVLAATVSLAGAPSARADARLERVGQTPDGRTQALYRPRFASAASLVADAASMRLAPVALALDRRGRVLLSGPDAALSAATDVLAFLDVATPQVLVEVALVETVRRCTAETGGHALFDRDAAGPNTFFRTFRAEFEPSSWLRRQLVGERPFEGADLRGGGTTSSGPFSGAIDAALRGLAHEREADVLVRPTLLCSEGIPAKMEASVSLPATLFFRDGVQVREDYVSEKAGVRLEVTAELVGRDAVRLRVSPWVRRVEEASSPDGPASYPVLGVREMTTTVEIGDGETIIAAGLEGRRRVRLRNGFPALDRLPALDGILASRRRDDDVTDLHVLVTTRIVQPGREPPAVVPRFEIDRCARAWRGRAR